MLNLHIFSIFFLAASSFDMQKIIFIIRKQVITCIFFFLHSHYCPSKHSLQCHEFLPGFIYHRQILKNIQFAHFSLLNTFLYKPVDYTFYHILLSGMAAEQENI